MGMTHYTPTASLQSRPAPSRSAVHNSVAIGDVGAKAISDGRDSYAAPRVRFQAGESRHAGFAADAAASAPLALTAPTSPLSDFAARLGQFKFGIEESDSPEK